jgi:hypothetical protein
MAENHEVRKMFRSRFFFFEEWCARNLSIVRRFRAA